MKELRKQLVDLLKSLKEDYGVISVKAEFEAEGSRKDELIMLREIVGAVGLGFIIKIGGCEAVHDLDQCKLLGATGVMAPMIETAFALDKFKGAVNKVYGDMSGLEHIINAETKTCLSNFDTILAHGQGFLTGVTVGRSDLSASMGIGRKEIESDDVFEAVRELCFKAKKAGMVTNFGGNIGLESIPFVVNMKPYIDRFETRKIVITASDDRDFLKKAISQALKFELLYLHFKSDYYMEMASEDRKRIERLAKQVSRAEAFL